LALHETVLGSVLYDLRDVLARHEDPAYQLVARFLIPAAHRSRV
jgi:hypothetical protein